MIEVLIVLMIFLFVVLWAACATGKCDENQSDVQQEKWIKKNQRRKGERKMKRFLMMLLTITMIFGTVTTANAMTLKEWIRSAPKIEFAKNVKTCISIGWTEVEDAEMYHLQVSKEPYFKTHADWHLNGNVNYIGADRVGSGGYITGLKDKPKYYVRIRAKVNEKYRRWSTVKKVKEVDVKLDTDQDYGEIVDNLDLYR